MGLKELKWHIYLRSRKGGSTILDDNSSCFVALPQYENGWMADPFLYENEGNLYVFAELYSYESWRGNIGYCVYKDGTFSEWRIVINTGTHFSYPNVFEKDGKIFMMPENSAANKIPVYWAEHFPDTWKEVEAVYIGPYMVDTTFLPDGRMLSYSTEPEKYRLCLLQDGECIDALDDPEEHFRPGGKVFEVNGKFYRPAQCCEHSYGESLFLNEIACRDGKLPVENTVSTIKPCDVILNQSFGKRIGIHTYNCSKHYEVIDVFFERINLKYILKRISAKLAALWKKKF